MMILAEEETPFLTFGKGHWYHWYCDLLLPKTEASLTAMGQPMAVD